MVKITGQKAHKARLKRIRGAAMRAEVGKAIYAAADYLSTEAALSITNGAVSGKNHVASDPGDPPNADTHLLDRSIHTENESQLMALSVADAPYAAALEGGSERKAGKAARSFASNITDYGPSRAKQGPVKMEFGDSKTEARPFMQPAASKTRPKAQRLVQEAVKRVVRGGTL